MPSAKESGCINRNIEILWGFIKDMGNWASCMPGYVSFDEINEKVSIWCLKGDVGVFKKKVDFTVVVTESVPPEKIVFTLEAKDESISGMGSYQAVIAGPNATEVEFHLDMEGTGIAKKVVNVLLNKTLPRDCKLLKDNLINVLETKNSSLNV